MMNRYHLILENNYVNYCDIIYHDAYTVKNKKDTLGKINFYSNDLTYKVIKRKTDHSFKKLLELIMRIDEDDNPSDGYMICLNEIDKFRHELINRYEKYLKKEQLNFLKKKIDLIEKDVQNKLLLERVNLMQGEFIEENKVSHHR